MLRNFSNTKYAVKSPESHPIIDFEKSSIELIELTIVCVPKLIQAVSEGLRGFAESGSTSISGSATYITSQ